MLLQDFTNIALEWAVDWSFIVCKNVHHLYVHAGSDGIYSRENSCCLGPLAFLLLRKQCTIAVFLSWDVITVKDWVTHSEIRSHDNDDNMPNRFLPSHSVLPYNSTKDEKKIPNIYHVSFFLPMLSIKKAYTCDYTFILWVIHCEALLFADGDI